MRKKVVQFLFIVFFLVAGFQTAFGFALLGPFAPWMTAQLSYQDGGYSIGGPMNIGEGYRWNVPVITYGFDPSFVNYFGSNGVVAVQSAIQILNDLPPASQNSPTNYPFTVVRENYTAGSESLVDLKSFTLSLLIEHMGLAQPIRFMSCLSNYVSATNYTMLMRCFDPLTLAPTMTENGTEYNYDISIYPPPFQDVVIVSEYTVNPDAYNNGYTMSVADNAVSAPFPFGQADTSGLAIGYFVLGLTYDDVGGLNYLLSPTNFALESLIPGVTGVGTNASNFVNSAIRPGVDKITFQQMVYDTNAGQYVPVTNLYTDSFLTNGLIQQQTLQRVITQPDVLFTVQDLEAQFHGGPVLFAGTGTSNWVNNGTPNSGPGVIQPPVVIAFDELGPSLEHAATSNYSDPANFFAALLPSWGSFDGTTNAPIMYPIPATTNSTEFRFTLFPDYYFHWNLTGTPNELFLLETSTDLVNWTNVTTITNTGGTFSYLDYLEGNSPVRYFRTIPQ